MPGLWRAFNILPLATAAAGAAFLSIGAVLMGGLLWLLADMAAR